MFDSNTLPFVSVRVFFSLGVVEISKLRNWCCGSLKFQCSGSSEWLQRVCTCFLGHQFSWVFSPCIQSSR